MCSYNVMQGRGTALKDIPNGNVLKKILLYFFIDGVIFIYSILHLNQLV